MDFSKAWGSGHGQTFLLSGIGFNFQKLGDNSDFFGSRPNLVCITSTRRQRGGGATPTLPIPTNELY